MVNIKVEGHRMKARCVRTWREEECMRAGLWREVLLYYLIYIYYIILRSYEVLWDYCKHFSSCSIDGV